MGAGSISLFAKLNNYRVLCNDHSIYGKFLGKGIIENNTVKIDKYDIMRLFIEASQNRKYCANQYCGELFTSRHAEWIDNAATILNVENKIYSPIKHALLNCLLIKFILYLRPYGNFTTSYLLDFFEQPFEFQEKKGINSGYAKDVMRPTMDLVSKAAEQVNRSIFYNGKQNKFYNKDVFEFIGDVEGDTLYLDPPYYGAQSYEFYYDVLNSILLQEDINNPPSQFNDDSWKDFLNTLLDMSQKFKRWIISFGCEKITPEAFLDIVAKHRKNARLHKIPYIYSVGARTKKQGEKQGNVTEILVVADD